MWYVNVTIKVIDTLVCGVLHILIKYIVTSSYTLVINLYVVLFYYVITLYNINTINFSQELDSDDILELF